ELWTLVHDQHCALTPPPNGSRLSCGRRARGRKAVERQTKRVASEVTQFLPTCEPRQLQAHVRPAADRGLPWARAAAQRGLRRGALTKDPSPNLRAPPASSACYTARSRQLSPVELADAVYQLKGRT